MVDGTLVMVMSVERNGMGDHGRTTAAMAARTTVAVAMEAGTTELNLLLG